MAEEAGEFYVRYYVGHKGKFGHEFLEFEFRPDGKLRYANNSNYKNDTIIRKELFLSQASLRECRRIISDSEVTCSSISRFLLVALLLLPSCFSGQSKKFEEAFTMLKNHECPPFRMNQVAFYYRVCSVQERLVRL